MNIKILKTYFCLPFLLPQLWLRFWSKLNTVYEEDQAGTLLNRSNPFKGRVMQFAYYFANLREYRSVFYHRMGFWRYAIEWMYPSEKTCYIRTHPHRLGGGISINHGHSLEINAKEIGRNLHVFQNVTIGSRNSPATPIIGDNVTIGAGAVVLGNIRVGNNVKIGANAVVVDDVPDNCTVVPEKSRVIKREFK